MCDLSTLIAGDPSTLTAVIVGGAVAGIPAICAAFVSAWGNRAATRDQIASEHASARSAVYEDFLDTVTLNFLARSAQRNALLSRRKAKDSPDAVGGPKGADETIRKYIARLEIHGNPRVSDAATRLYRSYRSATGEIATAFVEMDDDELANKGPQWEAALQSAWKMYYQDYQALIRAMRDDLSPEERPLWRRVLRRP